MAKRGASMQCRSLTEWLLKYDKKEFQQINSQTEE